MCEVVKEDWKIFTEKYATKHNISIEEALEHQVVKEYRKSVGDRISNDIGLEIKQEQDF